MSLSGSHSKSKHPRSPPLPRKEDSDELLLVGEEMDIYMRSYLRLQQQAHSSLVQNKRFLDGLNVVKIRRIFADE